MSRASVVKSRQLLPRPESKPRATKAAPVVLPNRSQLLKQLAKGAATVDRYNAPDDLKVANHVRQIDAVTAKGAAALLAVAQRLKVPAENRPPEAAPAVTIGGAPAAPVTGNDQRITFDGDGELAVFGNRNQLKVTGNCAELRLAGNNNEVIITGSVGRVILSGNNNRVTWPADLSPAPEIRHSGLGNTFAPAPN